MLQDLIRLIIFIVIEKQAIQVLRFYNGNLILLEQKEYALCDFRNTDNSCNSYNQ